MKNRRNRIYYWIGGLLAFIGMGAVAAGVGLILNPDGSGLGMKVELLAESPFRNFLIPGISLFLINGIGSFLGAALAFKRHIFSGIVTIILGAAMIIWISAQVYWVGWINWMQTFYFLLGIIEIILGVIVRKGRHGDFL